MAISETEQLLDPFLLLGGDDLWAILREARLLIAFSSKPFVHPIRLPATTAVARGHNQHIESVALAADKACPCPACV